VARGKIAERTGRGSPPSGLTGSPQTRAGRHGRSLTARGRPRLRAGPTTCEQPLRSKHLLHWHAVASCRHRLKALRVYAKG